MYRGQLKFIRILILAISCLALLNFIIKDAGADNAPEDNPSYSFGPSDFNTIVNDGYYNTNNYGGQLELAPEYQSPDNNYNLSSTANDFDLKEESTYFNTHDFNTFVNDGYYDTNNYNNALVIDPEYSRVIDYGSGVQDAAYVSNNFSDLNYIRLDDKFIIKEVFELPRFNQHDFNTIINDMRYHTNTYSSSLEPNVNFGDIQPAAANLGQPNAYNHNLSGVASSLSQAVMNSALPATFASAQELITPQRLEQTNPIYAYKADTSNISFSPVNVKGTPANNIPSGITRMGNMSMGEAIAPFYSATIGASLPGSLASPAKEAFSADSLKSSSPIYKGIVGDDKSGKSKADIPSISIEEAIKGPLLPGHYKIVNNTGKDIYHTEFLNEEPLNKGVVPPREGLLVRGTTFRQHNHGKDSTILESATKSLKTEDPKDSKISADSIFISSGESRQGMRPAVVLHELNHAYYEADPEYRGKVDKIWSKQPSDFQGYVNDKITYTNKNTRSEIIPGMGGLSDQVPDRSRDATEFASYLSDLNHLNRPEVQPQIEKGWAPLISANKELMNILPADLKAYYK